MKRASVTAVRRRVSGTPRKVAYSSATRIGLMAGSRAPAASGRIRPVAVPSARAAR